MGHIARKRFGQHFLSDAAVIDAIVAAIDPRPVTPIFNTLMRIDKALIEAIVDLIDPQAGETLVEIGPGLGAMTVPLLERCERLTVIELDRDLAARLRRNDRLDVVEADVLTVDFAALADRLGQPLRVVGNLPYNISTPILFHLLGAADRIVDQTFMLQKEVVERMAASPGSKDYGRLSVMLQWRYDIESLLDVPPEAFEPPPRVDSAVVRMQPLPGTAQLGELVTVAFSQRRKLLRHTLGRWLEARACDAPFDLQRRAEEVPVAEYLALVRAAAGAVPGQQ